MCGLCYEDRIHPDAPNYDVLRYRCLRHGIRSNVEVIRTNDGAAPASQET